MEKIVRTMKLNRVTAHTARFGEDPDDGKPEALGNIYVKKWALGDKIAGMREGDYPNSDVTITVTVEE
jgi:hypothetical protein